GSLRAPSRGLADHLIQVRPSRIAVALGERDRRRRSTASNPAHAVAVVVVDPRDSLGKQLKKGPRRQECPEERGKRLRTVVVVEREGSVENDGRVLATG